MPQGQSSVFGGDDPMIVRNFVHGAFAASDAAESIPVLNPATQEELATLPLSSGAEVDRTVQTALAAFPAWRRTPVGERVQPLFRLKALLEENFEAISRTITLECGKTLTEARGELRRGIENVEVGCGMPSLIQGWNNEDIAPGIDEHMIRQPLGVVAAITPFNFPGMIPLWFLPYAVATGNCFILKPSEKVPLTSQKLFECLAQAGFPAGVVQLINGGADTVNAILDHPDIRAISFVGSTPVARYVYGRATANGKRAQCQGGAKNPVVLMPDADVESTTAALAESAFGCAGQRCLALSAAITVGTAREPFAEALAEAARTRVVGYGLDEETEMGPVITSESRTRIEGLIAQAEHTAARILVDGRGHRVAGYGQGNWISPTVVADVEMGQPLAQEEVFGPVLTLMHAATVEKAIELVNARAFGNMACLFTRDGRAARTFRHDADAGNIGINIGVAAPMAFFPFSGWNESFFGDLHAQSRHGVEFYTQTKVVVERWP